MVNFFPPIGKYKVTYDTFMRMLIDSFSRNIRFPYSYNQYYAFNKYKKEILSEEEYNIITELHFKSMLITTLFLDMYTVVFSEEITFSEYKNKFFDAYKKSLMYYRKYDSGSADEKVDELKKELNKFNFDGSIDDEEKLFNWYKNVFCIEIEPSSKNKTDEIEMLINTITKCSMNLVIKYYGNTTFTDKII